jgi:hypothetical protein
MKRITKNNVTDALVEAMEKAGDMESVIILYHNKPELPKGFGMITNDDCSVARANFLVDAFKAWLMNSVLKEESVEEDGQS